MRMISCEMFLQYGKEMKTLRRHVGAIWRVIKEDKSKASNFRICCRICLPSNIFTLKENLLQVRIKSSKWSFLLYITLFRVNRVSS